MTTLRQTTKPTSNSSSWRSGNLVTKLTYISGIENEDPDLQNVIRQRFPNQTQSLNEAEVAFFSTSIALANLKELGDFYNRGGLIVMMRPSAEGFDSLGDDYLDDNDDGEEGYWDDEDNDDEDFNDNEKNGNPSVSTTNSSLRIPS